MKIKGPNRSFGHSAHPRVMSFPGSDLTDPALLPRGEDQSPQPLSWAQLAEQVLPEPDRRHGPTSSQARLRLFGHALSEVRVTLYRDHHAWCPYCQKIWLWLEEKRIPYKVKKVAMVCYGQKEGWYRRLVPSGMLPALELDGELHTESDQILAALERRFGPLGDPMEASAVLGLRQLERLLFRAWCQWLCTPGLGPNAELRAQDIFERFAAEFSTELSQRSGPFLLGRGVAAGPGTADLVFIPYVERMSASLAYYKGYLLRQRYPAIDRWMVALEQRDTYLGCQSDFHTHAHDLPPQMGGCYASGTESQGQLAQRIDRGPWPILSGTDQAGWDPETSQPEPDHSAAEALSRVLRHREPLLARGATGGSQFDRPLRCALTTLISGQPCVPPAGSAASLRYLRDRISVPRDMSLHAARRLRQALEVTACLDPTFPEAVSVPVSQGDRLDQDPAPFLPDDSTAYF
jgi:glutathione S-transferase